MDALSHRLLTFYLNSTESPVLVLTRVQPKRRAVSEGQVLAEVFDVVAGGGDGRPLVFTRHRNANLEARRRWPPPIYTTRIYFEVLPERAVCARRIDDVSASAAYLCSLHALLQLKVTF